MGTNMNLKNKKILVTGGAGFLGSQVIQELIKTGVPRKNISVPRSETCDLRRWENCQRAVKGKDLVIHLAAKVGGIGYNQANPAILFYENAIMGIQLMEAARQANVKKFVAVGTVCAYPKFTPTPFKESDLWNGYPEETNAPYGLAKKMLLVQAQAYRKQYGFNAIYLLPVNLYGPGDNFDPNQSHVIPALISKITQAQENDLPTIDVWGTGKATREFLYVKDAARAIVRAAEYYDKADPVNIGSGQEISIKSLVGNIGLIVKYKGKVKWDKSKPDGQSARRLDVSRAKKEFGFVAETDFMNGLRETIVWYLNQ